MNETWQDRIEIAREAAEIKQEKLAELVGHGQSWVSNKLNGKRKATLDDITLLARAVNEDANYILTGQRYEPHVAGDDLVKVPLISNSDVALWPENSESAKISAWITPFRPNQLDSTAYAIEIFDDTMESQSGGQSFTKGTNFVVLKSNTAEPGAIVVAQINGKTVVRLYSTDGVNEFLRPLNNTYPMTQMGPNTHILGIVKEAFSSLSI